MSTSDRKSRTAQVWVGSPGRVLLQHGGDPYYFVVPLCCTVSTLKFTSESKMAASAPAIISAFQPRRNRKGDTDVPLHFQGIFRCLTSHSPELTRGHTQL